MTKATKTKKQKLWLYAFVMVVFVSFGAVTVSGDDGLFQLVQLKNLKKELEQENQQEWERNLRLRQEIKSLYDLKYIEYEARKSLGMVYEEETVFIVSDD